MSDDVGAPRMEPGDRWFFCGPTGSGKTQLITERLVTNPQRTIYVTPKSHFSWGIDNPRFARRAHTTLELGQQIEDDSRAGFHNRAYVLHPPHSDYERKNVHKIDKVFEWAMRLGDTCVAIDDAFRFFGGTSSHREVEKWTPRYIQAVTEGREGRVTVVILAQRCYNLPIVALSESDVRGTFYMRNPDDQKRMEDYCGEIPWETLARNEHSYIWATDRYQSPPLKLELAA